MEKANVIKMRTALKAGKNLPLKVYIDNAFYVIDEGAIGHFVKWDDENEILYQFKLPHLTYDPSPSNISQAIAIFAVGYDNIQCMEMATLPLSELDNEFATIGNFSEDYKKLIKHTYKVLLDPDNIGLTPAQINKLIGSALNDKDDYYAGKLVPSFLETKKLKDE